MSAPRLPNWLLFLGPALIWGTTWLTIKFQFGVVPPEVSVVYRFTLASLLLFAFCALRRMRLRFDGRTHAGLALLGVLHYSINYVLVYRSEGYLTSGLVAVVFVLVVAWNLAGARLFFGSPILPPLAIGALLGTAGVTLVFWPEVAHVRGAPTELLGLGLALAATVASSAGALWSQRLYARGVPVVPSTAWSMLYGAAGVAVYCAARRLPFAWDPSPRYLVSLAYLAVFGSVLAFTGYLTLLKRLGAGTAGYTAVAIPVLAMVTSTVFEGYRWSVLALAGMALVAVGNVMVLRGRARATA